MKLLTPYNVSAIQMTFIRSFVAVIAMAIYILITNRELFKTKMANIPYYIGSGVCIFLTAVLYYISMQRTSVATSVILMYMAPAYVMIYSVLFLKEKFSFKKGFATVLMLCGCALVSGIADGLKYDFLGICCGVLSGISYGAYSIITKIEMQKKFNSTSATFYCYVVMAILAMTVSNPIDVFKIGASSIEVTGLMIGLGILTFTLPYFFYNIGLRNLPAGTASSLAVFEPLAATLYSVLFFSEPIGLFGLIGFFCVIISVIILSFAE